MSYSGYIAAPSGTFTRSSSIDHNKHVTYTPQPTPPTISSLGTNGTSQPQLTTTSQRSLPPGQLSGHPPALSDVHPLVKSSDHVTATNGFTDLIRSSGKAPGFTDLRPPYQSANGVTGDVTGEAPAPTLSGVRKLEPSKKGGETEVVNPHDYVGISLVGKKYKQVNPEAYYVEKDYPCK